jgi:hypothetical protein
MELRMRLAQAATFGNLDISYLGAAKQQKKQEDVVRQMTVCTVYGYPWPSYYIDCILYIDCPHTI